MHGIAGTSKYAFYGLEIGESVVIEASNDEIRKMRVAASMYGSRFGKWFTTRKRGNGKYEITRVPVAPRATIKATPQTTIDIAALTEAVKNLTSIMLAMKASIDAMEERLDNL